MFIPALSTYPATCPIDGRVGIVQGRYFDERGPERLKVLTAWQMSCGHLIRADAFDRALAYKRITFIRRGGI